MNKQPMTSTIASRLSPRRALRRALPLLVAAMAAVATAWAAGPVQVKARLDSVTLLMGRQTALHIEVVQDRGAQGHFLNLRDDILTDAVEVARTDPADTSDIGSGREEIRRRLIIQAFDSGLYTIPPFAYVSGGDTVYSNDLPLKVIPANVDTLTTVHDYAGTVSGGWRLWDFVPDFVFDYWWVMVLLLLAGVGVAAFIILRKRLTTTVLPQRQPTPPYELAMQALARLKEANLCERGQEKEYYTRLTEILRTYLEQRFAINAMEMTSTQIMRQVRDHEVTRPSAETMRQVLEMADFVKFAKVRPLPDDNARSFAMATDFVEATKPAPQPAADPAADPADKERPAAAKANSITTEATK